MMLKWLLFVKKLQNSPSGWAWGLCSQPFMVFDGIGATPPDHRMCNYDETQINSGLGYNLLPQQNPGLHGCKAWATEPFEVYFLVLTRHLFLIAVITMNFLYFAEN